MLVAQSQSHDSSSPSSAESSFRQIDDVFLQTQTRIWLGEVLKTRLSEEISVADLLADGEFLFAVSREVWKMMLEKHMELKYTKAYDYELFASRHSGRYMPYSNVDSFLKICKILGLSGIDLFSPSDVVEKRDTRKVCMCIRALSKKARSKNLNVPDFDIVTYTAAMPTDMVGYIRRSWELSHCDYSSSSSLCSNHELRERSRQKHLNAISGGNYDLYYEASDGTGRKFSVDSKSDSSATICLYSQTSQISSDSINSPGVFEEVTSNYCDQSSEQLDVQHQIPDEYIQCQQVAVCSNKLTRSCFSHNLECDHEQDNIPSPSSVESNNTSGSLDFGAESGAINSLKSTASDQIYFDHSLEDGASVVGDSVECSTPKSNISDDCAAMSATFNHNTCYGDSDLLEGKELFDAGVAAGSFCSEEVRTPENKRRSQYIDSDVVEVSSIASVSSLSIALQNLDFVDHLDSEDAFKNDWFRNIANSKSGALDEKSKDGSKYQGIVKYETPGQTLVNNNKDESLLSMEGVDTGFSSAQFSNNYSAGFLHYDRIHMSQRTSNVVDEEKVLFAGQSCFPIVFPQWDQKGKCQFAENGGHGVSSLSLSPIDSNKENIQLFHTVREGALWLEIKEPSTVDNDMKVCSTTMVKSDQLSSLCCDDFTNTRHRDPNASCKVATESENVNKDEGAKEKLQKSTFDNSDRIDNPTTGIADCKPQKRPLLKTIVKGTAVVGAMLLLLHFRKNRREKSSESNKQSDRRRNLNGGDLLPVKEERNHRADGVYPAEKLKLGRK